MATNNEYNSFYTKIINFKDVYLFKFEKKNFSKIKSILLK